MSCTRPRRFPRFALALASLLASAHLFALDTQRNLPIDVASNSAELNDQSGIAKYKGDVIITQGESKLQADEVSVTVVEQRIQVIEANGTPATFQEGELGAVPRTFGSARTIRYDAASATLVFQGKAELVQQGNTFSGEQIIYDIQQRAIQAKGDETGESRVKIRYRPSDINLDLPDPLTGAPPEQAPAPENTPSGQTVNADTQDKPATMPE